MDAFIQLFRPSDKATSESWPFKFTPIEPGKQVFWLLRSLNPDFDILANILADTEHPLTKELLKIQRTSGSPFDDFDNDDDNETISNHGRLSIDEHENDITCSDDDSSTTDEKCSTSSSQRFINSSCSFSSKEAIDNLSTAKQEKLEELGVVFSENEEADELAGRHFLDFVSNVNKLNTPKEPVANESNENCGLYTSLQMAMKNKIKMPELKKINIKPVPVEHYEPIAAPPRPSSTKPNYNKQTSLIESETLPPLPPKRVKKDPSKSLPALPQKETPKLALFRKLWPKLGKSKKNLKNQDISRRSSIKSSKSIVDKISSSDSEISLTEAEHYALYTSVAPRATVSEFDENSCYYSPVEAEPVK